MNETMKIEYNGQTIAEIGSKKVVTLKCEEKRMRTDITFTTPEFGAPDLEEKTITANGVYTPSGDGFSKVTVNVTGTPISLQEKTVTENNVTVEADEGYTGLSKVTVNVPPTVPALTEKNITENGTYNASSDGVDGYSVVTVNVSKGYITVASVDELPSDSPEGTIAIVEG